MTTAELARRIRCHSVRMCAQAHASHVGSCLSVADILAVVYNEVLKHRADDPTWPDRDRLIFSKGHAAAALYAALAEMGYFPIGELANYCVDGSILTGHVSHKVQSVELATGSLGHGLPVGCGLALAAQRSGRDSRVFAILSDGELDEGSNWEAALFAGHHCLDTLTAIVDYNKIQSFGRTADVLNLEPLGDKWRAFGWSVHEVDGHSTDELSAALTNVPRTPGRPTIVIAHTIKGKGVSFMEDKLAWHYQSPQPTQLADALAEVGC